MPDLLFHPATESAVEAAISRQTHAILLTGQMGSGKTSVANYIAKRHLQAKDDEHLAKLPYLRRIGDEGSISVESIRELKQFLSLKTTGLGEIRRVVIIEHADSMNDESQNALLKALEEPPADTVLILCASDTQGLRATIRSRSQSIQVLAPPKDVLTEHFKAQGYAAAAIGKAYTISGGLVGLMQAILAEDTAHPLVVQIEQGKQLLGSTAFDRLKRVDELAKQKTDTILLLTALKLICSSALQQAALKDQAAGVKRWHATLRAVNDAESKLQHNPSLKLLLTDLFLAI